MTTGCGRTATPGRPYHCGNMDCNACGIYENQMMEKQNANEAMAESHDSKVAKIESMNLDELAELCWRQSHDKGFWHRRRGNITEVLDEACILEKLFLVQSELSEAGEHYRDGRSLSAVYYRVIRKNESSGSLETCLVPGHEATADECDTCKPDGFAVELADAIIRILDVAGRFQVPVQHALAKKLVYNQSREQRHGGKLA